METRPPTFTRILIAAGWIVRDRFLPVEVGTAAPAFAARDMEGRPVSLESLRGEVVLLNIWATWCPPCRMFAPVFEKASNTHSDVMFAKVDTDANQGLSAALDIRSIPTLMAFRDGILVFSQPGALPAPALEKVLKAVRELDMDEVRAKVAETAVAN